MRPVRILTFHEKKGQNVGGRQHFEGCGHFGMFWTGRAGTSMPVQYGRHAAHISWAGLRADSTWGLHGDEATPSGRRALQGD